MARPHAASPLWRRTTECRPQAKTDRLRKTLRHQIFCFDRQLHCIAPAKSAQRGPGAKAGHIVARIIRLDNPQIMKDTILDVGIITWALA